MYKGRIGNRRLLSNDLIVLVLISFVMASAIALYFLQSRLQEYSNRSNIGMEIFIQPPLMAAVIAIITINFQAIKAVIANPLGSLRTEWGP